MLNNMPMNNSREDIKRKVMFIIIGIICVISIILAVVFQILQLATPEEVVVEEKEIIDFSTVFNNQLNLQEYTIKPVEKINEDKDIVYARYDLNEKVDGKFELDIKIPIININTPEVATINDEIDSIFREKARNIITSEEDYEIIYSIEYTAYINSNILSLVIKSNLKEGVNAQRVIVKSYTYNITTNELIDIDEMLSIKQLNKADVQNEINNVVAQNAKEAQNLIELGYKVYERNLSDKMYKIENVDNFFYGPDGALYIIYAYGNNSYTTESDIVAFR